jgi:hypothetical protein
MSFDEFQQSAARDPSAPPGIGHALEALWHDGRGDWDRAHACAQEDDGPDGAWVHAYLHRKEGDPANAAYWYRRAGRPVPPAEVSLKAEWADIARELLSLRGRAAGQRAWDA